MSPKPRRAPGNRSHLQRLANAAASDAQMPAGRYQRWINTHIIAAALDRVRDEDGEPLFTLKGGAAMELRLGLNARASKDYDAAFRARADDMLDALDHALAEDWHGFQGLPLVGRGALVRVGVECRHPTHHEQTMNATAQLLRSVSAFWWAD